MVACGNHTKCLFVAPARAGFAAGFGDLRPACVTTVMYSHTDESDDTAWGRPTLLVIFLPLNCRRHQAIYHAGNAQAAKKVSEWS